MGLLVHATRWPHLPQPLPGRAVPVVGEWTPRNYTLGQTPWSAMLLNAGVASAVGGIATAVDYPVVGVDSPANATFLVAAPRLPPAAILCTFARSGATLLRRKRGYG
jgi:hypothetical protein